MPNEVLSATELSVSAPGGVPIVAAATLRLCEGEIVGLTGASGSGKSTLGYALMGLARRPLAISGGSVRLLGDDLLTLGEEAASRRRGRDIAFIVQNPRAALHPMLTVGRQIGRIWRFHHGGTRREAADRAVEMLRLVGINDAERRSGAFGHELSGGMAQRALIAAALSANPSVLIADEPTSGLDVTVQADFLDMMAKAARERGTAMLLVTQEPGILANYCDRILVMDAGRIVSDEPVASHFARHSEAALIMPAPVPDHPVVEVRSLSKTYPVRDSRAVVHAVDTVSFDISAGETLGLVGESGSGKTTVGRAMIRLIKPDSGAVRIDGADLEKLGRRQLRQLRGRVQLVRQDPFDSFDPRWRIVRSVGEPLSAQTALDAPARTARVELMLKLVGAGQAATAFPRALSAGMLQRIAIARALASEPRFVVLDEPTSVLTPGARQDLVELLARLQAETGVAFLFISHDLTTVASISHRVAVMYLGQIVETGATRQIFAAPRHPYTRALISAHLGVDPAKRRVDAAPAERLEGEIPSPIDLPAGCYLASRCGYARPRCHAERQALLPVAGGAVRCWRVDELSPFSGPMR